MFADRAKAGQRLAEQLEHYRDRDLLVLAIPRGGVEVGYEVARQLEADLDLIITRKLPYPYNTESGFGAIAEDGSTWLYQSAMRGLSQEIVDEIIAHQKEEIERRIAVLRNGRPLSPIAGRTVILVDDGIAVGSTMRASIALCKNQRAEHIVVGTPVAGAHTVREIGELVDEMIAVEVPTNFRAVAQVYQDWYDVSDQEVLDIMARWRQAHQSQG